MNHFFKVKSLESVLELSGLFSAIGRQAIPVADAFSRVLASDLFAEHDMPGFRRATMDGYAVKASDTFGASEGNPAWLDIAGSIGMGEVPELTLTPGRVVKISTGGMLPKGADSVVMVEHTQLIDESCVEIYKSVAPLQHVIDASEDFEKQGLVLPRGTYIRPQEQGLIAGMGRTQVDVFDIPKIGIISTGDEITPIDHPLIPGKIRDINAYSLSGFISEAFGLPIIFGIVPDDPDALTSAVEKMLQETDMVLISGGSSVGKRDYTVEVLSKLPDTEVLVHGISISPGKPTILASSGGKPVWGLPGQVTSAMVVLKIVVIPFLNKLKGLEHLDTGVKTTAQLTRNVASAQGRRDFIRVSLENQEGRMTARPVLGKSGLIKTMIYADGLLEIPENVEGVEKDTIVDIILL